MDFLVWSLLVMMIQYNLVITGPTQATSHTVFRAARYDTGGLVLYDLWSGNDTSPAIDQPISWQYFNTSEAHKQVLKSAILECAWDKVQEVEFAFYSTEQRVMFHTFNISGSSADKMDWFSPMYLADSTYYADLAAKSSFLYFSVHGQKTASFEKRFYVMEALGGCDTTQRGWSTVMDVGHIGNGNTDCTCTNSPTGQYPAFAYSPTSTIAYCPTHIYAETMLIKVTLEENAFGGYCVSACVDVGDGWYQSCIGCNVYVKCQSGIITHHSCSGEHEFDDLHKACVSPHSTTCVGGLATGTCIPPLGDIPVYACDSSLMGCVCETSPNECVHCDEGHRLVDGECIRSWPMISDSRVLRDGQNMLYDNNLETCIKTDGQRPLIQMRLSLDNNTVANLTLIGRNLECDFHLFASIDSATATSSCCQGYFGRECTYVADSSVAASHCVFDCTMENAIYEVITVRKYFPDAALQICEIIVGVN